MTSCGDEAKIQLLEKEIDRLRRIEDTFRLRIVELDSHVRKLSCAVEQCSSVVMITDIHGGIEYCNSKFFEITGYEREETLGKNVGTLGFQEQPEKDKMWETLLAGGTWQGEFYNTKKNGEPYWEKASIAAIRCGEGEITHFVKVAEDITQLKKMQTILRLREEELLQKQQRIAILKFSNEIALDLMHEFRNPMVALGGLARLIARKDYPQEKLRKFTKVIVEQTERLEHSLDKTLQNLHEAASDA